jgi:hypothetical protein
VSLMPTLCPSCRRVHLAVAPAAHSELSTCRICGGDTRLVPGCSFAATDRDLFEELSYIVEQGGITTTEAEAFGLEAQRALWSGAYNQLIERLASRLAGLLPIQVAIGKNSGGQRRLLAMLRVIFDALSTLRTTPARADPSKH